MMKNTITKYRAEKIMGFTGVYTLADVKKTYRKLVKKAHPDAGGSEEKMIELNQAYEFMEALFDNDRNLIVTCDTEETSEPEPEPVYAYDSETPNNQSSEAPNASWNDYIPRDYHEEAYQRYSARYDATNNDEAGAYKAYQEAETARQAAQVAREKMYAGEKPALWRIANTIISGKASSTIMKATFMIIGLAMLFEAMSGAWNAGSMMYVVAIAIFLTAAINCFIGTITDDLRKSAKWLIDTMLKKWQETNTEH